MGKNKKNKNRNVFDINDDTNDTNDTNDTDDWTPQQNKKKIMTFALLDDDNIEEPIKQEPIKQEPIKQEPIKQEPNKSDQDNNKTLTKQEAFQLGYSLDLSGNYLEAIKFYKIADKLGSKSASGNLAILLDEHNLPEAEEYYKKAIRSGNVGSLYDYAEYLIDGVNGETNAELALKYFSLYMNLKNANFEEKFLWKNIISKIIL